MKPCRAKHVRRVVKALRLLGAEAITVDPGSRIGLRWTFAGVSMSITTGVSCQGNAFEQAWHAVRSEFRHHLLPVSA